MDNNRNNPQKIAAEAVGERPANATPPVAKEQAEGVSGEVIRHRAFSAGPQSSVGTRTAEAMGERGSGGYAYPDATPAEASYQSRNARAHVVRSEYQFGGLALLPLLVSFGVGYGACWLIHSRH